MAAKSSKIITIGSSVVDIIAVIADNAIERVTLQNLTSSFLMLEEGRKVEAQSISDHVGGGAANAAVSFKRQGFDANVLSILGQDLNAEKILAQFREEGIGTDLIVQLPDARSGSSIILSSHDRNAAIFTYRGANALLTRDKVLDIDFGRYGAAYITSLSGESEECFELLLKRAQEAGCFVAVNPGIRQLASRANEFATLCKDMDLISLNRVEMETLLPELLSLRHGPISIQFEDSFDSPPPLLANGLKFAAQKFSLVKGLSVLHELGPAKILLTDGKEGAYYFDGEALYWCGTIKVTPVATAGAGDAFTSTFVGQMMSGRSPRESLVAATINAGKVISVVDTQSGLLSKRQLEAEVDSLIGKHPLRVWKVKTAG